MLCFGICVSNRYVVGDDFVVLSTGLGFLWGGASSLDYLTHAVVDMTTSEHVLPVGSVATVIYVKVVELIAQTPLNLLQAWGVMRVVMLMLSVLSATLFVSVWMKVVSPQIQLCRRFQLVVFNILAAALIAFAGIHALWSYDPIVSYALAGWGTTTLIFLFLTFLGKAVKAQTTVSQRRWCTAVGITGILGILFYEMFVAGLAAGIFALIILVILIPEQRYILRRIGIYLATGLPFLAFVLIQIWRLRQPQNYSGTSTGFQDLIIPVWINSLIGNLPLTTFSRFQREMGEYTLDPLSSFPQVSAVIVLLLIAGVVAQRSNLRKSLLSAINLGKGSIIIGGTALVVSVIAAGIFALSSKYQVDIGLNLGNVYLAYAPGLLSLGVLLLLVGFNIARRSVIGSIVILFALLLPITSIQWSLNNSLLNTLKPMFAWTGKLLDQVENPSSNEIRCSLIENLSRSEVPDWYREDSIEGLSKAISHRHGVSLCDSLP